MATMINVYAFRSGEIGFCKGRVPEGALRLLRGPARALRRTVSAAARHAYDNRTLLVPGVPEATDGDAALLAASRFRREIQKRLTDLTTMPREEATA